jgi:hypothetical protein
VDEWEMGLLGEGAKGERREDGNWIGCGVIDIDVYSLGKGE